jgi:uncharacterized protein (UPF0335 family)
MWAERSIRAFSHIASGMRAARRIVVMTEREARTRAVKILAKSIYRDLESQGFDQKEIV